MRSFLARLTILLLAVVLLASPAFAAGKEPGLFASLWNLVLRFAPSLEKGRITIDPNGAPAPDEGRITIDPDGVTLDNEGRGTIDPDGLNLDKEGRGTIDSNG